MVTDGIKEPVCKKKKKSHWSFEPSIKLKASVFDKFGNPDRHKYEVLITICPGTADVNYLQANSGTMHQIATFMFNIVHGPSTNKIN